MKKFEYRTVYENSLWSKEKFNELGDEGWELIQTIHDTSPRAIHKYKYLFKREKQ
jgi:hypothetical protein